MNFFKVFFTIGILAVLSLAAWSGIEYLIPYRDPQIEQLQKIANELQESIDTQRHLREQAVSQYQELLQREQHRRRQAEERISELEATNAALQAQREQLHEETDLKITSLPSLADIELAEMIREDLGPVQFEPVGLMFETDRAGAEAIAESLVEWSACRQELGILEEQLDNCRNQVIELESIADTWELQHDSAMQMVESANEELKVRDQLEENLRQRLEAERMRAEKAEGKLFWKQLERFLQGAAVGGVVGVLVK